MVSKPGPFALRPRAVVLAPTRPVFEKSAPILGHGTWFFGSSASAGVDKYFEKVKTLLLSFRRGA